MWNKADDAVAERQHVMVEAFEREAVEISEITGDVEFGHLTLTAGEVLASCKPPVEQENARTELFSSSDQNLIGAYPAGLSDHSANGLLFLGTELDTPSQFFQVHRDHLAVLCNGPEAFAVNLDYMRMYIAKRGEIPATKARNE